MNYINDFNFGFDPIVDLDYSESPSVADKLAKQVSHLRLQTRQKGAEEAIPLPDSPKSFSTSSAASIHSTVSDIRPSSNYWRVPDKNAHLTSIAMQSEGNLCAIGSGDTKSNLYIYEVYADEVTHHQTISIPEIQALQWASPTTKLGQMGNVLASGHRNGTAHLILLPDASSRGKNAEILKRFNHAKHLPRSSSSSRARSPRIRSLNLTGGKWSCCAPSSLLTLCGDHIFLWEPNRSDVPLVMQKTHNANAISLCDSRDGVFALGRKRGVCIRDLRVRDRANSGLKPPVDNSQSVSLVTWNPHDGGNQLAAVHERRTIKIWDIRSKAPLASYSRHADTVTSIEWSKRSELVSASADGTVRVWDTENAPSDPIASESPERPTAWSDYSRRQTMDSELEHFTNELIGNVTPVNQSRHFLSMSLAPLGSSTGAVTIDSGGYLGVHELLDSSFTNFSSSSFSSLDFSSDSDSFSH